MTQSANGASRAPMPTDRRRVYFNEFNILMGNAAYLPIVSGLLQAQAETSELLKAKYEFMPFLYHTDDLENILAQYDTPSVAAFSLSMWNEQLSLKVAEAVNGLYPDCLIVFGGPNVPHHPHEYFKKHPFIDVAVRGEGEEAFSEILTGNLESREFSDIAGIAWRDPNTGACIRNDASRPQSRDLDVYPSPYIEGLFDYLLENTKGRDFQQIIETNRGCPFLCTFCFWGQGGLSLKYRFHSLERVADEIDWAGRHGIKYMFNADSNFGMHKRDYEIAQILVDSKTKYGYPEKFRTCFGKNTDDKIYEVAKLLHQHELEKGITLARQSNNEEVLENIKRANIKMSTYQALQVRFNETNIPVYCELILGLPGETYETWLNGIDDLLQNGLKNQLFVYMCQVYPNTELHDVEYRKKFGVNTLRIPLTEIHGSIRHEGLIREFEEIIVSTNSMPSEDWRKAALFSWMTMLLHSMKLGFFILYYLHERHGIKTSDFIGYICDERMQSGTGQLFRDEVAEFKSQLDWILQGNGRGRELPEFGPIYWDEEEASFLRISDKQEQFYDELPIVLKDFLNLHGVAFEDAELAEAVQYQRLMIPGCNPQTNTEWQFDFNFPEYFEACYLADSVPLAAKPQTLTIPNPKDYHGDKNLYAKETILWGRKSGTMLTEVEFIDA